MVCAYIDMNIENHCKGLLFEIGLYVDRLRQVSRGVRCSVGLGCCVLHCAEKNPTFRSLFLPADRLPSYPLTLGVSAANGETVVRVKGC